MPKKLQRGDAVSIYFKTENAAPYRVFGVWIGEDEEYLQIKSTVGDNSGHELFILKNEVKMIEVLGKKQYAEWE